MTDFEPPQQWTPDPWLDHEAWLREHPMYFDRQGKPISDLFEWARLGEDRNDLSMKLDRMTAHRNVWTRLIERWKRRRK